MKNKDIETSFQKLRKKNAELLNNIKTRLPELKKLKESLDQWVSEDYPYRFYHQSFKTYWYQSNTLQIVEELKKLSKEPLNKWFQQIINEGTGQSFEMNRSNSNWLAENRPQLEAFFHAKFMLEMAIKYGEELKELPQPLPSGWAALLYLYDLR